MNKTEMKPRVVVTSTTCYQAPSEQPIAETHNSLLWAASDQLPYKRVMMATVEWQRLDAGWIKHAAMLQIVNRERMPEGGLPSFGDVEQLALEVSFRGDRNIDALVYPGQQLQVCPNNLGTVEARCRPGVKGIKHQVTVHAR